MQHCNHVAAYFWHLYNAPGVPASQRNCYHAQCMEYGLAAKDAQHAARWFRYGPVTVPPVTLRRGRR